MCSGRMKNCWNWPSTLPAACLYWTTSVVALGALACLMCAISPASLAAPPLWYLMSVLIVQAASPAVNGLPSLHLALGCVLNVHVLPPFEAFHDFAKNGA